MKKYRNILGLWAFIAIAGLVVIPIYSFAEEDRFDQELINAGKQRATQMGLNPVCFYLDEEDHMVITQSQFAIRNSRVALVDEDMVINVGKADITIWETILKKGEYGIIKNGKIVKGKESILPKNSQGKPYR